MSSPPGIFARPPRRLGWKNVSAIPASAGRQNRKIFFSLIEKIFGGAQLKMFKKIFLFCSAVRRVETLGGISARQGRNCCSKKVRASFSNCDQTKLDGFCGQFVCSLAPPAAGLRSHFSAYFGIKS